MVDTGLSTSDRAMARVDAADRKRNRVLLNLNATDAAGLTENEESSTRIFDSNLRATVFVRGVQGNENNMELRSLSILFSIL